MNKYLIEFILDFTMGVLVATVVPFIIFRGLKDIHIRKRISEGAISYLHSSYRLSKKKMIFIWGGQIVLIVGIVFYLIFFQVPIIKDIPALIAGDFLSAEGSVTEVRHNRAFNTIHIQNVKVKESTWFFITTIKENNRYKISYLKNTKSIIKVEKLD